MTERQAAGRVQALLVGDEPLTRGPGERAAAFCENVLALLPAVWRFVVSEGIEPTNNHAERLPRRGVLWRKREQHPEGVSRGRVLARFAQALTAATGRDRSPAIP